MKIFFQKRWELIKIKNEIDEIKKWKEIIKRKDFKYESNKYRFDFQQFETIRPFGDSFHNDKIIIKEAEKKQNNLFKNTLNFNNKSILKSIKDKKNTLDSINALYVGPELIVNAFRSKNKTNK